MMRTTGSGQSLESQCNRHVRFTPKADMCSALAHVCYGPEADIQLFKSKTDIAISQ